MFQYESGFVEFQSNKTKITMNQGLLKKNSGYIREEDREISPVGLRC